MEEMWKRTDVFNQECMTAFIALDTGIPDGQPLPTEDWDTVTAFFERKWEESDLFIANGGQKNQFADASAVEDLQARHAEEIRQLKEENALAISAMEKRTTDKLDKPTEAMLQMAQERQEEREQRRRRPSKRQADDDSSSDEEEEPAPPPPKRKKRKRKAQAPRAAPAAAKSNTVYVPGEPFQYGMKKKANPTAAYSQCFADARNRFISGPNTRTILGLKERLDGYRRLTELVEAGRGPKDFNAEDHKARIAKWEKVLEEVKEGEE